MPAPRLKQFAVGALLSLLVGSLLSAAFLSGLFANAQLRGTDFLFTDQTESFSGAIVIVGIDQRSYREMLPRHGPLVGWSRALYAQAIDRLRAAGARVIALDLFFDAPGADDSGLIDAISRAGNVVFPVEGQGPGTFHPALASSRSLTSSSGPRRASPQQPSPRDPSMSRRIAIPLSVVFRSCFSRARDCFPLFLSPLSPNSSDGPIFWIRIPRAP